MRSDQRGRHIQAAASRLSPSLGQWLRRTAQRARARPPVGFVSLGDLDRVDPISPGFGVERGGFPIDRWYIERFLERNASAIRGRVLEVADDTYARKYGRGVEHIDVLHLVAGPGVSVVADLCAPPADMGWNSYDCIILTQTLQFVRHPEAAFDTLGRLLRSGGVLLATAPGISQISRYDADRWGDRWRFTTLALSELAASSSAFAEIDVSAAGNVLAAVALLHGLVVEDLSIATLASHDRDYEVIVCLRGVRR